MFEKTRGFKIFTAIFAVLIGIFVFFPLLWMINTALKPAADTFKINLFFGNATLQNFVKVFHSPDKDVTVPFMGSVRNADAYSITERYQAAAFNGEKGIRLWYILPKEGDPLDLIPDIRTILTQEATDQLPMLNVKAPVLDIDGENLALKPLLMEKGYTNLFTDANLEQMLTGVDAAVEDIRQKTRLQVDEKGFKAAAVTEIVVEETAAPDPVDFLVDSPFLLVIEYEGLPLFISHIADPSEK